MNPSEPDPSRDDSLDRLFRAARTDEPPWADAEGGLGRLEYGFETRLLARIREERATGWLAWAWQLCPFAAALAIAAGVWSYARHDEPPDRESMFSAVKLAGMPVLDYYLGRDE